MLNGNSMLNGILALNGLAARRPFNPTVPGFQASSGGFVCSLG